MIDVVIVCFDKIVLVRTLHLSVSRYKFILLILLLLMWLLAHLIT